ncbi:hypothetical protein [Sphingopyxis sp.]|uniref:hypothetical protein n=1 Tax=Sphingopyxis sp. TaxID=1908224 RepID=UPI0034503B93
MLFHLPTGLVQRHPVDRLDDAQPGQQIIITLTAQDYPLGPQPARAVRGRCVRWRGRSCPARLFRANVGAGEKLFPLGEARQVSGRPDSYGEMR